MKNKISSLLDKSCYALVAITPKLSLKDTAEILSPFLNDFTYSEEYDEFPAYTCTFKSCKIILFGIPAEGVDILDHPIKNYQLEIFSDENKAINELENVSQLVASFLKDALKIECYPA